ncbi:hypothetical protein JTE90_014913 [Oedothorax gibbosus]|uniref:Chitin-binding type-2 domain-containing protein n=1 Tax=Oedothorax gibbosus TaxID=931172 RepID=A0AAV6VMJ2_9ARAC|nr:hypothetical protein JTE90_014913 [Oedothorax gibbosus]
MLTLTAWLFLAFICSFVNSEEINDYNGLKSQAVNTDLSQDSVFACPSLEGRFPHPKECGLFFECHSGYPQLMKCAKYQLYDEQKQICRLECLVDCKRKEQMEQELDQDKSYKCPDIFGSFEHSTFCWKYYICVQNIPTLFKCPNGTLYHTENRECLEKSKVDCGKRLDRDDTSTPNPDKETTTPRTTKTITKPNTPPPTDCEETDIACIMDKTGDVSDWFECPGNGLFPHGSSKQLFIHCDNHKPFVQNCGEETYFSPEFLVCMWIEKTTVASNSLIEP